MSTTEKQQPKIAIVDAPAEAPRSSALATVYTCHLCRKTFSLKDPILIGEKPQERLARVGQMLADHLGNEHRQHIINIMLASNQYAGWLIAEQFSYNDATLATESNKVRLKMREVSRRVIITDALIEQQVSQFIPQEVGDTEIRTTIIGLLRTLRDTLEEIPKAQPQPQG